MLQYELKLDSTFVKDWIENFQVKSNIFSKNKELNIVDIYSGCGGMTLGALAASVHNKTNFNIELAIDFNKESHNVYLQNFQEYSTRIINDDIKNLFDKRRKNYQPTINHSRVDILFAGPPCQGHSDLNNSTRRNDDRNQLYHYSIKAIETYSPEIVIIENVAGVIHSKEKVVQKTKCFLKKNDYYLKEMTINFQSLGIPQKRERHILIASKNESFINSIIESKRLTRVQLYDFIVEYEDQESTENLLLKPTKVSKDNRNRIDYLFKEELYDLPNHMRPSCHRDKEHSYKSCYGRLRYNEASQTITSGFGSMGQGRYVHPTKKRTILAIEAARIQGFPKSFSFENVQTMTSLRKMIANAVPPQLTYFIADKYLKLKEKQKEQRAVTSCMTS
ncbi:MAG: DNA cytosine methyltransferase [Bacteroidota bacterium]